MSKVVRVVGGVIGGVVGFVTGQSWLVAASVALFLGGVQEMILRKPRISNPGDPFRDRSINLSDPVGALPVIYGEMTVGVHRVWAHTEDEDVSGTIASHRFLYILCAIGHGPVKSMPVIFLDGQIALVAEGNRFRNFQVPPFLTGIGVDWFDCCHAQWASGTDGQQAVIPTTDSRTLVSITRAGSGDDLDAETTVAHGFVAGDVLRVAGNSVAGYNLPGGYTVKEVPTPTTLKLAPRVGQPTGTGTGGTIDFYNMDPATIVGGVGPEWSAAKQGKGVAYLLLRFRYDTDKFSGQVPQIEVNVEGRTIRDTRAVTTLTVSSTAAGPARTGYASTTDLTFTAVHGLSVGAQLQVTGHSAAYLNGSQRVDEVVDTDTVRIYTPHTAGTGGAAEVLTYSRNPAMVVRDYLTSPRYGVVVPTEELDEPALEVEANYCDETVVSKLPSTTRLAITGTQATNPVEIGIAATHNYVTGNTVRIWNHPIAGINGEWTVTVVDGFSFTIPFDNSAGATTAGGHVQSYRNWPRYQTNAWLSTAESLKTNLEKLLTAYRAQMVYQGGIYRTWTRRVAYPSAFELTPQNIIPGTFRFHRPGLNEMANTIRAAYYFVYQVGAGRPDFVEWPSATGYSNPELEDEDNGFVSQHEIDLPCTTDSFIAEQIAQIVRNESRAGLTVGVTAKQDAMQLAVGDLVPVTHDTPDWTRKWFWVLNIGIQADGLIGLTLLEYDPDAYTTKWYPDET